MKNDLFQKFINGSIKLPELLTIFSFYYLSMINMYYYLKMTKL
jgi:hypothetical protein